LLFKPLAHGARQYAKLSKKPAIAVYQGILLGRQLHANYRVAEQLAGRGDYRGMTVSEVANLINQQTI